MKSLCVLTITALAVSLLMSPSAGAPQYQVIDLGTLSGAQSMAYGINSQGEACGYSDIAGSANDHAFYWHNGTLTDINPSGYPTSSAFDINDIGHIVGVTYESQKQYAFVWKDGTAQIIGSGLAQAINNSDEIVGYSGILGQGQHKAFWYCNGVMTDLGSDSVASGINDSGQIVGNSVYDDELRATLWENGQITYLDSLGGHSSTANDINDVGEIVGYSTNVEGAHHAVLWENGNMVDLGSFGGHTALASGINNHHQAVGYSSDIGMVFHAAFLWQDGIMMDINNLISKDSGWKFLRPQDINDSGQIVGYASYDGRSFHAVILNPVPEPSSIFVLGCGFGCIAYRVKCRVCKR